MGKLGPGEFEAYYTSLFGERWPALRTALVGPAASVAFATGLERPYFLDAASLIAALAVEPSNGDRVVDLCAAPGGKSLVIASRLPVSGMLACNERSSARRARLHRVLDEHLPPPLRQRVTVTGRDAARWGVVAPASCERVLVDVPCSSERHVIASRTALAEWSASRPRRLAAGAYAIACAAVDALVAGGRAVYSTCALSPRENDGVVERLLRRARSPVRTLPPAPAIHRALDSEATLAFLRGALPGEATEHGWQFMPDRDSGLGPIYMALLERLTENP